MHKLIKQANTSRILIILLIIWNLFITIQINQPKPVIQEVKKHPSLIFIGDEVPPPLELIEE